MSTGISSRAGLVERPSAPLGRPTTSHSGVLAVLRRRWGVLITLALPLLLEVLHI